MLNKIQHRHFSCSFLSPNKTKPSCAGILFLWCLQFFAGVDQVLRIVSGIWRFRSCKLSHGVDWLRFFQLDFTVIGVQIYGFNFRKSFRSFWNCILWITFILTHQWLSQVYPLLQSFRQNKVYIFFWKGLGFQCLSKCIHLMQDNTTFSKYVLTWIASWFFETRGKWKRQGQFPILANERPRFWMM